MPSSVAVEAAPATCPRCAAPLPLVAFAARAMECPLCHLRLAALAGAAAPPAAPAARPVAAAEGQGTCFFHADNAAASACETCGRFVCRLCEVDAGGRRFCPACFDRGRETDAALRQREVWYDSAALWAGWAWMFMWPSWVLAAPAVVYWTIAKWSAPSGYVVPRGRWRYVAAIAGLVFPIVAIAVAVVIAASARLRRG